MRAKTLGLILGLAFGLSILYFGLIKTVFLAVCAGAGWFLGRVVDGEVSLADLVERTSTRDRF